MRSLFNQSLIVGLFLVSVCFGESRGQETASGPPQEINDGAMKDLERALNEMCQPGQLDLESDSSRVMASFKVDPDGAIPRDSLRIIHSSGSRVTDTQAIRTLWLIGESHLFQPFSSPSRIVLELRSDPKGVELSLTSYAATPEEANARVTKLRFLSKLIAAWPQSKYPMISELLGHAAIEADNKGIYVEMYPCR